MQSQKVKIISEVEERAISILVGNLNLGHSYLITTVIWILLPSAGLFCIQNSTNKTIQTCPTALVVPACLMNNKVLKNSMAGGKTQITRLANSLLVHFFEYHIDMKIPYENLLPLPSLLLLCTHILCTVVVLSVA